MGNYYVGFDSADVDNLYPNIDTVVVRQPPIKVPTNYSLTQMGWVIEFMNQKKL